MKKESLKKAGIWALAVCLFMAHFLFRSVAHADEGAGWQQVFPQGGNCSISFPTTPQMVRQSLKIPENGQKLHYDVYLSPYDDKGVFLLLIATYPKVIPSGHEIAGLEGLIRGIVGHNPENSLVYADLVEFNSRPAINFLIQSGANYFRGTALMSGNKLFLIAMEGKKGTLEETIFTRFIQSFQLLAK